MYNFTAAPWKTQRTVRQILAAEYTNSPGGLSGNDDAGQMSAWYVFATLGLYPLNPASDEYQLCAPLFDRATLCLAGGKTLEIITHKAVPDAAYIASVRWNGQPYSRRYLPHADLAAGGRLKITLQATPATGWARLSAQHP